VPARIRQSGRIYAAVGKLASGSVLGYALLLILSPVLTRLYSPTEFGLFAIFGAIVAVGSIFLALSLEIGVLNARRMSVAVNFYVLSVVTTFITSAGLAIALLIWTVSDAGLPLPDWAMVLAILSCALAVLTTIGMNWAIRQDRAGIAAKATFSSLAGRSGFQVFLGWLGLGLEGLLLGEVIGRLIAFLVARQAMLRLVVGRLKQRTGWFVKTAIQGRSYPVFLAPSMGLDTLLTWLPAPLFALAFDPVAGGLIAIAQRFGTAPITIANQTVGQVFHKEAVSLVATQPKRIRKFIYVFAAGSLPLAAGMFFCFWVWGEPVASTVLGEEWAQAGFVAALLVPVYYVQFISLLTNRVLIILGYMSLKLFASALHVCIMLAVIAWAKTAALGWETALIAFSGLLSATHLAMILVVMTIIRRSAQHFRRL
jgi:lipopolysaccharide exporter